MIIPSHRSCSCAVITHTISSSTVNIPCILSPYLLLIVLNVMKALLRCGANPNTICIIPANYVHPTTLLTMSLMLDTSRQEGPPSEMFGILMDYGADPNLRRGDLPYSYTSPSH
eukprot:TRINITY_DN31956_c0_g1_i1.p1 TRINITY_DN31956_c0_g1~~TRINITY_DN31956_c0_g1_i1.p1  ORF type:complete len:114 (+),score=9.95 TRINITY_DN31956_c0_g1_i1:90-431(+)